METSGYEEEMSKRIRWQTKWQSIRRLPPKLSRRSLLTQVSSAATVVILAISPARGAGAGRQTEDMASSLDLAQFMQISRVLTGFKNLDDDATGETYLGALNARPEHAAALHSLWRRGGFSADRSVTIRDLEASGLFADRMMREIADTVIEYWYSGTYVAADGEQRVATFIEALAWRSLGYRDEGLSTCSGDFGSWSEPPAA